MNFPRISGIMLGSALLFAGTALGQVMAEPPTSASGGSGGGSMSIAPPAATPPALTQRAAPPTTAPAAALPTAEAVLQRVLSNKTGAATESSATTPLIAPLGPVPGADGLLREGQKVALRSGHLKRDDTGGGGMLFVFDPKDTPAYPPMGLAPSRRLAAMEDAAGFGEGRTGSDMTFRISAEVTEYRGKNYLCVLPSGTPVPAPATPVKPDTRPLVEPVAPNVPQTQPTPLGNVVTNRIGRLVRDAKTGVELIAFDADGKQMAEPPLGVLPCKYLAVIEDATDNGNKPLKFRVSGEVTTYRGKNYLYLKFVQQVRDLNGGIGAGSAAGG